jgi:putative transposase
MGSVRIGVGTEWLCDGRTYRVVRQLAPDRFIAQDVKFLVEQEFSTPAILAAYAEGRLRFASGDSPPSAAPPTKSRPRTIQDLTEHGRQLLQRRWHALEPLTKLLGLPKESDYTLRSEDLRREGISCSARTLRRYYRAWHRAGKDRVALVPQTDRKGARGCPRRNSWLHRHPQVCRLVEEAISTVYLNKARRPIAAVTRRVLDDLQRMNARLPAAQAIPVPREAALARAIGRRIAQMDPWEVDRERWGRRIADMRHAPKKPQQMATRILQRVEIDHTPLKVVVGTEAGPIGQPWLTILIDYYSRLVVGFCLGFEPPSYAVLMEGLRHAILPKTYLAQRYPKVQRAWPCCGLPEKLVCDRGPDLTSQDLEDAAFQLGIELDFNPPRTPHFKGTVESFFDGLNDQLSTSLPGRTFRNWADRADYKPDDGPLLSYEALLEIIHIYLVDVYSIAKHPTAEVTRLEMWQESAAVHSPMLPAAADDLLVLLAKHADRTLSARGIELGGMFYTSDDLMALRAEMAAHNVDVDRLSIRYNPWDLGEVWVLNPVDNRYLKATAVDPAMKGMTAYQWRVLKRAIRQRFDGPEHLQNLSQGRNAIRDVVEEAIRKPSRSRRVRAARFLQAPPSTLNASVEQADRASVVPPSTTTDATPNGPAPDPGQADASPSVNPSPTVDPADLDVSDWEIASPDL